MSIDTKSYRYKKPCIKCDEDFEPEHYGQAFCVTCTPRGQQRKCLKCDRKFWSQGFSNRLCQNCNELNRKLPDIHGLSSCAFRSFKLTAKRIPS